MHGGPRSPPSVLAWGRALVGSAPGRPPQHPTPPPNHSHPSVPPPHPSLPRSHPAYPNPHRTPSPNTSALLQELDEKRLQVENLQQMLSATIHKSRSTEEHLTKEIERLEAEVVMGSRDVDDARFSQLQNELQDLRNQKELWIKEKDRIMTDHEFKLQESRQAQDRTTRQLRDTEEVVKILEAKLKKFEADEKLAGTAVVRLTDHIAALEVQTSHSHKALRNALHRLGVHDLTHIPMDVELCEITTHLAENIARSVEDHMSAMEEERARKDEVVNLIQESNASLQERLNDATNSLAEAHKAVTVLNMDKQGLLQTMEQYTVNMAKLQSQLEIINQEKKLMSESLDHAHLHAAGFEREVFAWKEQVETLKKDVKLLEVDRDHWKSRITTVTHDTEGMRKQIHSLLQEKGDSVEKMAAMERDNRAMLEAQTIQKMEISRLSRQLTERETAISQLRQERNAFEAQTKYCETEINSLRSDIEARKIAYASSEDAVAKLRESESVVRRLKSEMESMKLERDSAREAHQTALQDVEYFRKILLESKPIPPNPPHMVIESDVMKLLRDNTELKDDMHKLQEELKDFAEKNYISVPRYAQEKKKEREAKENAMNSAPASTQIQHQIQSGARELQGQLTSIMSQRSMSQESVKGPPMRERQLEEIHRNVQAVIERRKQW